MCGYEQLLRETRGQCNADGVGLGISLQSPIALSGGARFAIIVHQHR